MTTVKIAQFKSRLSDYLRRVRHGEHVVVTDRETPIAHVTPYRPVADRLVIPVARELPRILKQIKIPPAKHGTDSLKALKADREDDLEL